MGVSGTTASSRAIAWALSTDKRISAGSDPNLLAGYAAQADRYSGQAGLDAPAQAELHLTATAACGKLAELHVDQNLNGLRGFRELQTAVALAPDNKDVAAGYGRALLIISHLNMFIRFFATRALGIDLQAEMGRDLAMLQANPQDPLCQVLARTLAGKLGDSAAQARASRQIALLRASDPAAVAKAQAKISSDTNKARNVKKS